MSSVTRDPADMGCERLERRLRRVLEGELCGAFWSPDRTLPRRQVHGHVLWSRDPHCNAKPDPATATSVEGDPQYEILGPDKLRINYSEGYRPIYLKCTADIHPLLEYSASDQSEEERSIVAAAVLHALYLIVGVAAYRHIHRRTSSRSALRRRLVRTGVAALLFSPGVFFSWPFAAPSFALLALLASLASVPSVGFIQLPAQLVYTVGPIVLVWALLFAGSHLVARFRSLSGREHRWQSVARADEGSPTIVCRVGLRCA